jgi:Ran GTPase-activating protein (RanGAP) involved in mRNA processing and transport
MADEDGMVPAEGEEQVGDQAPVAQESAEAPEAEQVAPDVAPTTSSDPEAASPSPEPPEPAIVASSAPVPKMEEEADPRSLMEMFGQRNDLLLAYVEAKQAAGGKVNHLVERSLTESMLAASDIFFLEAPGNHPLVFKNRLSDVDMNIFSRVFKGAAPFLDSLDFSYNHITDDGIEALCGGLIGSRSRSLQRVVLCGNSIGSKGCDKLCQALKKCPKLLQLDISQNPLGRVGGLMLVEFLQSSPQLMELLIADTEIDIDVLVAISAVLLTGTCDLKVLSLENPRIQTLQEDHTVHLGRMLRVDTSLREIYLGKHKMRDDGVRQLVSFLMENKTLRVLDLRCNELGAEGARNLGTLLRNDCQLVQLNLSSNRIGENGNTNGAQAIAEALLGNRMLKHLDLNNNCLCGEALRLLGEAIDQNSTLQSIALFHSNWEQESSYKFHQILNDRARILPLRADFITHEVDLRIDICKVQDFVPAR